ncbi:MAG TPA: DUF4430 domain-containing protein [bacterium]|nr:DUF4430 domain-containing protein [bacterium]
MKKYVLVLLSGLLVVTAGCTKTDTTTQEGQEEQTSDTTPASVATVVINDGQNAQSYEQGITTGITAYDLLASVAEKYGFTVDAEESEYGVMINGINGIQADTTAGKYWLWNLNGEMASVGADAYEVQPGDSIEFVYGSGL